jgi:hypothetical protein
LFVILVQKYTFFCIYQNFFVLLRRILCKYTNKI